MMDLECHEVRKLKAAVKKKYEITDPPWVPVTPRTTRRGFSEDMVVCEKKFDGSDDIRVCE
jgi:hypothetical protein